MVIPIIEQMSNIKYKNHLVRPCGELEGVDEEEVVEEDDEVGVTNNGNVCGFRRKIRPDCSQTIVKKLKVFTGQILTHGNTIDSGTVCGKLSSLLVLEHDRPKVSSNYFLSKRPNTSTITNSFFFW